MKQINTKTLEKELMELPELQAGRGLWQNNFHEFDVYDHTLKFAEYIKQTTEDANMIIGAYLHDIGKPVVAKPKIKEGVLQEKSPGMAYHEFTDHEKVGEEMVIKMNSEIFERYGLNQEIIARLVGAHFLPMKGIKEMRKTQNPEEFKRAYNELIQTLEQSDLPIAEIMEMFLADSLSKGKGCTDQPELMAVRDALLGKRKIEEVYEIQKQAYGGKE